MSLNEVETVKQKRLRELEDRIDAWIYDNGYLSEHREAILDFMSDSIDQAITSTKQEAIEEGKEIAYGNVAKWFVVPIKLQDDTNCGVCGGALAEIRSKHPGGEKRKVCPTCAIEILEDVYSSCANRTASQLKELQDRKVEE